MSKFDRICLLSAIGLAAALGSANAAPPAADPDWPCMQRKVPTLTPATIWTGPSIAGLETAWHDDAEVSDLAQRIALRRVPIEDAQAQIAAFASKLNDDQDRQKRLTLLFAAVFDLLNTERGSIMEGIDRYARRQEQAAKQIRAEASKLEKQRQASDADPQAIATAQTTIDWQTRIFQDRRSSLQYVCDLPRTVERRLYNLTRAIQKHMPQP